LWLIVGLGNPGEEYKGTRHNAGFMFIDRLAGRFGAKLKGRIFRARTAVVTGRPEALMLVKPMTHMNLSGVSVKAAVKGKGVPLGKLVIVHDDLDLPLGSVRIRRRGSPGSHKGMKSITEALGTGEFARIRIGIGPRPEEIDATEFVLSPFRKDELLLLEESLSRAEQAFDLVIDGDIVSAMSRFNRKLPIV